MNLPSVSGVQCANFFGEFSPRPKRGRAYEDGRAPQFLKRGWRTSAVAKTAKAVKPG
jgi:hypothetical protein